MKYILKHYDTGEIITFDKSQLLNEINRDRSDEFAEYTSEDISTRDGVEDALSLTDYSLLDVVK